MSDDKPAATDPNLDKIEATDNGLRPEDGEQTWDGTPIEDLSRDEIMAKVVQDA